MDDYTEQKVNEALFDHREEAEEVPEEPKEVSEELKEMPEEPKEVSEEAEKEKVETTEMQEPSLDDLLSQLNGVKKEKWQALLHFNTTELKSALDKEGEVRESLKKMNWW